ncbi:MAG TPA: hypothetical protein VII97_10155 [Anaerolineales bacterium]
MREWTLGPGDPLALTLAADFRLCTPDYVNDHIWELETSGGDPPALSLRTTYGLRARTMRLFPRFTLGSQTVSDPAAFPLPPRLRRFFPNFLSLDFSPLPFIDVVTEYLVPDSHTVAGRFTVTNRSGEPASLLLELCGQLAPLEGQSLTPRSMQSANILAGRTADLAPVIFLTGGPQSGPGPYPSLILDLALAAGGSRTLTWVQAALATPKESFELARRIAARPWEAERAKIEMVNAAQTIDVRTGDPDWDAAFALSQKTAFSLFFGPNQYLPNPSFVLTRQPDQGYSPRGDGNDYSHLWSGQPSLEAFTLASLLPGAPELAAGLVRNFLIAQSESGVIDWKPGLAGQRGRLLATPLLASLAWQTFQQTRDLDFLREVQPGLEAFTRCWFDRSHDRDGDGFPEWDHPLQTSLEDNPAFTVWQAGGQGAEISTAESPALAALLCREAHAQAHIAEALDQPENRAKWEIESDRLRLLTEECWDADAVLYHLRDRDTHRSPAGKALGTQRGAGLLALGQSFRQPVRLLIRLELKGEATRRPEVSLRGQNDEAPQTERLERMDFQWGAELAVATTRMVYTSVAEIEVAGLEKRDRVSVSVMDFSAEDVTLFLPLWAGIPNSRRAIDIVNRTLLAAGRFGGLFGIPVCEVVPVPARGGASPNPVSAPVRQAVHLPWNALIGEGLLGYGLRAEAAQLTARLMAAVIQNLKQHHAFARAYHVENGAGIGERNPVQGLAPLGLFLDTLGVRIESPRGSPGSSTRQRVVLSGKNPFPWSVTVKYRGLTITRHADQTLVVFQDGQTVTLDDPTDAVVSAG